ncbi:hypothetical protein CGRA01v4_03837 [Colletotrichum graminicola]|nr:hypothetical protein CGRA01v4_03837 [Colletotrichum graminicola]
MSCLEPKHYRFFFSFSLSHSRCLLRTEYANSGRQRKKRRRALFLRADIQQFAVHSRRQRSRTTTSPTNARHIQPWSTQLTPFDLFRTTPITREAQPNLWSSARCHLSLCSPAARRGRAVLPPVQSPF